MYSKLFNTDYMILDELNKKIKIIHYLNLKINNSMNREERIKHMFYSWDEEKEILREDTTMPEKWITNINHTKKQLIIYYGLLTIVHQNNTKDTLIILDSR